MLLQLKAEGDDPPALRRRVKLKPGLEKYRDMFRDLSAQRDFNEAGVQSITIGAIRDYLDIDMETRPNHRKFARRVMLEMDAVFMDYVRKQQNKGS